MLVLVSKSKTRASLAIASQCHPAQRGQASVLQATPIKPNFTPNLGSNVIKPNLGSVVNNKPLNPQVIKNPILSGNVGNKVPVPVKPLPGNVVNPGIVNKLPNNVFQNIGVKPLPSSHNCQTLVRLVM